MSDFLPKEVREGLEEARRQARRRASVLSIRVGEKSFPVLRFWENGFALEADNRAPLRGLVDMFERQKHLYTCLIVTAEEQDGEIHYEFKRSTEAADRAPLDFYRETPAPVAYLPKD